MIYDPMLRCMNRIDFPHFVEDYIAPNSRALCGLGGTIAMIRLPRLRVSEFAPFIFSVNSTKRGLWKPRNPRLKLYVML